MQKSQAGESPDQVCGHSSWRVGRQVEMGYKQEEGDVLEVILMGPTDPLNIRVSVSNSSPRGGILWVCKDLDFKNKEVTNVAKVHVDVYHHFGKSLPGSEERHQPHLAKQEAAVEGKGAGELRIDHLVACK